MNSHLGKTLFPKHIAIIMDGNGRWANHRHLPRAAGHKAGVKALRKIVEHCIGQELQFLTVYAFSSENWRRPEKEVGFLMDLFITSLDEEVKELHKNGVRILFIGNSEAFPEKLQSTMNDAEVLTFDNKGLNLNIAANYGGRWDIATACQRLAEQVKYGVIQVEDIDEELLGRSVCLENVPEPDLFIRTGGERRISNYLLWQIAYTELYFTDVLWPDFDTRAFDAAVAWFAGRQRRFGQTSEQVESA